VKGVRENALSFDGKDDYAKTDYDERFAFARRDFTLEAWVNTVGLDGMRIIGNQRGGSSPGYSLGVTDGNPFFIACGAGRAHQYVAASEYIAGGSWRQIAGVRRGDSVSIYVDGALDATVAAAACDISPSGFSPEGTWLGMARFHPEPVNAFEGMIDEVRVYDRALTADQIKQNYEAVWPTQ